MKTIVFTGLLTCLTLGASAQNHNQMNMEAKKEAWEGLKMLYKFDTGDIFRKLDNSTQAERNVLEQVPWKEWEQRHRDKAEEIGNFLFQFGDASLQAVEDNPQACRILFRGGAPEERNYSQRMSLGLWEKNYHRDEAGNCYGFRKTTFYDLDLELQVQLTDRNGVPVYIDTEAEALRFEAHKETKEAWLGIELPLTAPLSQIAAGNIKLKVYAPQEYDVVTVECADTASHSHLKLGDRIFDIRKIDRTGFLLAADAETMERLKGLEYLYSDDSTCYKSTSMFSHVGDLEEILAYDGHTPTFEEWLAAKNIDPQQPEKALERFLNGEEQEEPASKPLGKSYRTGLCGERLSLYIPAGEQHVAATISLPLSSAGQQPQASVDTAVCHGILSRLLIQPSTTPKEYSEEELLEILKDAATDPAPEGLDFATPDNPETELEETAYAIGYILGHELSWLYSMTAATYKKTYAEWFHKAHSLGVGHSAEIIAQNEMAFSQMTASTNDEAARVCIYYGSRLGAYHPQGQKELKAVDALILHVLKTCRTRYDPNVEKEYAEFEYCSRLRKAWEDYLTGEMNRAYNMAYPPFIPSYPISDHFFDAQVAPYWTDPSLQDEALTPAQRLAAARAKFEDAPIAGAAPRWKDGCCLTVGERNALLASNRQISYATGVEQAEQMMRAEQTVPEKLRTDFRNAFLTDNGQTLLINSFAAGVHTCKTLFVRYRDMLENDNDAAPFKQALQKALQEADRKGYLEGMAFAAGTHAVQYYRICAAWDMPTGASGQNLNEQAVIDGFGDFVQKRLKMGVEYAHTLTSGRAAAVMDLGERECATSFQKDFHEVQAIDPLTLMPAPIERVLPGIMSSIGLQGQLTALLTIEADGTLSKVETHGKADPALAEAVTDALYRMRFTPAQVGETCVARVLEIPFFFR